MADMTPSACGFIGEWNSCLSVPSTTHSSGTSRVPPEYRCWNQNSPDTGGIVGDDWAQIDWRKINFLTRIGLNHWYV